MHIVQALMLPTGARTDGGDLVQDWLEGGKLGKALLRRYDDAAESCRELAVGTLSGLMQVCVCVCVCVCVGEGANQVASCS